MGPSVLKYSEIEAYLRLMKMELTPWEIARICEIDRVLMKAGRVSSARDAAVKSK